MLQAECMRDLKDLTRRCHAPNQLFKDEQPKLLWLLLETYEQCLKHANTLNLYLDTLLKLPRGNYQEVRQLLRSSAGVKGPYLANLLEQRKDVATIIPLADSNDVYKLWEKLAGDHAIFREQIFLDIDRNYIVLWKNQKAKSLIVRQIGQDEVSVGSLNNPLADHWAFKWADTGLPCAPQHGAGNGPDFFTQYGLLTDKKLLAGNITAQEENELYQMMRLMALVVNQGTTLTQQKAAAIFTNRGERELLQKMDFLGDSLALALEQAPSADTPRSKWGTPPAQGILPEPACHVVSNLYAQEMGNLVRCAVRLEEGLRQAASRVQMDLARTRQKSEAAAKNPHSPS